MLFEKRPVTLPRRHWILRQGAADRREYLAGLPCNLIDQIDHEEAGNPQNAPPDDGSLPVKPRDFSGPSPGISNAAIDSSRHVKRSTSRSFCFKLHSNNLNVIRTGVWGHPFDGRSRGNDSRQEINVFISLFFNSPGPRSFVTRPCSQSFGVG